MSLFLLFQLCPACLVRHIWIVLEMDGRRRYSNYFVGCCFQDLFDITSSIFMQFPSSFLSIRLVSVYVVHLYSRIETTAAWKKLHYILSDKFDFHMIDNLSIAVHTFASRILMSFSADETLLPKQENLSTNFREPPFCVEMSLFFLIKIHVFRFVCNYMETKAFCCLLQIMQQGFSLGRCICQKYYVIGIRNSLYGVSSASCLFFSLDLLTFQVRSLGRIMNRYGANISPNRTSVTMSKKSVSPSGERTFTFVFL